MAVPDFQSLTGPLLSAAADGADHSLAELRATLAAQLGLSEHDLLERLPSGRQRRFDNRVAWASVYLTRAGLLERTGRGWVRITSLGHQVLKDYPNERISINFLLRFPGVTEFRRRVRPMPAEPDTSQTPQEALQAGYETLREALAVDLLDRVKKVAPEFFERLVLDLLLKMGYGGARDDSGEVLGRAGDGGLDGVIKQDPLGLDMVYVQAKRWQGVVGRPVVQAFAGSLDGVRARKGVLITTSSFSQEAKDFAASIEKRIVLIDGENLAQLMIEYGVGVSTADTIVVKKIDMDYFEED